MLIFFRNFFTPTEENRGVPTCLSGSAFAFYILLGLAIGFSSVYTQRLQLASLSSLVSFSKNEIIALANNSRTSAGLSQLQENILLDAAADKKADDMLAKQYFAHTSPDNKTPWFFIKNEGYQYSAAGENLAIDYINAIDTHSALMGSPTHRANILSPLYTQIGVAVVKGVFENRESLLVVQFFGKPKAIPPHETDAKQLPQGKISQNKSEKGAAVSAKSDKNNIGKTPISGDNPVATQNDADNRKPAAAEIVKNPVSNLKSAGEVLGEKTETIISFLSRELQIKLISWGILGLILISLMFLVLRGGIITLRILSRSLFLLLVFGYLFFFGIKFESLAKIQPIAQSVVEFGM